MDDRVQLPDPVPYIVHESDMTRMERCVRRATIIAIIAVIATLISNMVWLYAWMQYDYTSDMSTATTTTVDLDSGDGGNANYIGENGDIINGESESGQNDGDEANPNPEEKGWVQGD